MEGSAKCNASRADVAPPTESTALCSASAGSFDVVSPPQRVALSVSETRIALAAALDAIGMPAFVLTADGEVQEASQTGWSLLESDPQRIAHVLVDAILTGSSAFSVTLRRLESRGGRGYLATLHMSSEDARASAPIAVAGARWKLTARQCDVLGLVARGLTNATIAEMLGIGVSTVEFHLRALFDRAGVDNRATLVARVLEL